MRRLHSSSRGVHVALIGLALVTVSLPAVAQTRTEQWYRFEIGGFVLKDLPPAKVVITGKEYIEGIEYERFELQAARGKFEMKGTPLSGNLTNITIKGRFNKSQLEGTAPLLDIEPNALRMTLSSALPPMPGFYGGTITAPQQRVWIANPEKIHVTSKERVGQLRFELDPVRITGLKLSLPIGGDLGPLDFFSVIANPAKEGIPFALDIATNRLTMIGGTFQTKSRPLAERIAGVVTTDDGRVEYSKVSLDRAQIKFSPTTATLELTGVRASSRAIASVPNTPAAVFAGTMTAKTISGTTALAPDAARFPELIAETARFAASPAAACASAFAAESDSEREFMKSRGITTLADENASHLAAAVQGLNALGAVEFAMHVPLPKVIAAIDGSVAPDTRKRFGSWGARGGTLLSCGDQTAKTGQGTGTIRLALRYAAKIDDQQLALTPALGVAEIVKFDSTPKIPLQDVASAFLASTTQVATPVRVAVQTVKLSLPIVFDPAIRSTGQNAGVNILTKNLAAHGPIAPVIVVDASGMHIVGRIQ